MGSWKSNSIFTLTTYSIVVLAAAVQPIPAQVADSSYGVQAAETVVDTADEGPHILWRGNSSAVVLYMCGGEVEAKQVQGRREVRFNGFCSDSATEYVVPTREPRIEPFEFKRVPKILAVSDIHGEYEALVELLKNAGVIDDELRWSWGEGHFVINGDVFDRGDKVTECLWLIHRLEREAREAGGRVQYVLGNHEMMVLRGDNRYVNQRYLDGIPLEARIEHEDLFGPDMEFGRWLRSKHAAVKINDIVFVHGGLSPDAVARELDLGEINELARHSIDVRSYEIVFDDTLWFLTTSLGPFWYRGYHGDRPEYLATTPEEVDQILDFYDASAIVVGHTERDHVESLYDGKVFGVDVPVDKIGVQGLLWQDGGWYRVTEAGELEPLSGS